MATDNTSSGTGAMPGTGSPEMGTTSNGATPAKPTTTLEEALAKIAELERHASNKTEEAARHGKNLSAAEKELAAYKEKERQTIEANLSEVEKANKARTDAETKAQQYQKQLVNAEVKLAAKGKGIINPELIAAAVRDQLEYDDDGIPANLDKVLDELIKNNPYLVAKSEPASPAQTAAPARTAPALPAMQPGRSSIQPPTNAPQIPRRLTDGGLFKQ